MIACGWCGAATKPGVCGACGRPAAVPWEQRGLEPPSADAKAGRPVLDEKAIRKSWNEAKAALIGEGANATIEAIAERLDRSPRTVREWRARYLLR